MRILFTVVLLLSGYIVAGQLYTRSNPVTSVRVMFYNLENLFDTEDDSLTGDDEFTPEGSRHWNKYRLYTKLNHTASVIIAAGGWEPPALIGLCEVENRFVLERLCYSTALEKFRYRIIHRNSPDKRGIDVAMIYNPEIVEIIHYHYIRIEFPDDPGITTRDELYVKARISRLDTLHFIFNHWPSRYGGYMRSREMRKHTAGVIRKLADSILETDHQPGIVIMGDFNDEPGDESVREVLGAVEYGEQTKAGDLVNLLYPVFRNHRTGTHKYGETWGVLDQIIISGFLLHDNMSIHVKSDGKHIFDAPFLLTADEKFMGKKPFRTFNGFTYLGGFSDHLPVFLDLLIPP